MIRLDFEARKLGVLLGLGDLNTDEPCHGYANCCECSECRERASQKPLKQSAPQPWDVKAA